MTAFILPPVAAAFALGIVCALWRLVRGPHAPDRVLALDTMYVNALALLVVLGMIFDTSVYFEAALVIALLGFLGTVVLAKVLQRRAVIERS